MKFKLWLLATAIAIIAGCGGGGGGGTAAGPAGATVSTFATDSINDDFDHVWVTVYKVTAEGDDDAVLMDDSAGRLMDLKALRDATGPRYALLDDRGIKSGNYRAVRVELDENLTLMPKGSSTGQARKFAAIHAGNAGRSVLKLISPLNAQVGRSNLVLDFDLATWNLDVAGRVVATLKRGNGAGLEDHRRHEREDFHGFVAGLSGTDPDFTFNLTRGPASLAVKTDANTRIFTNSGTANPTLNNGLRVEVTGTFAAGVLLASAIKIEDVSLEDRQQIKGLASNLNEAAGTLDVAVKFARGFVPDRTTYSVTTTDATMFRSDAGATLTKSEFFAALAELGASAKVEAGGTVDGGTFAAKKLKIEGEREHPMVIEVKGAVTALDATAGSLTLTVRAWQGMSLGNGVSLSVTTSAPTEYRLGRNTVDQSAFFAGIQVGSIVEAKGRLVGRSLNAIRLKDDD